MVLVKNQEKRILERILSSYLSVLILWIILVLITLIIWSDYNEEIKKQLNNETFSSTKNVASQLELYLNNIDPVLDEVVRFGVPGIDIERQEWINQVKFLVENFDSSKTFLFVGKDMVVTIVVPTINKDYAEGSIYIGSNSSEYTEIIAPLYENEAIEGFVIAIVDVPSMILATNKKLQADYLIEVIIDDKLISSGILVDDVCRTFSQSEIILVNDKTFTIVLTPSTAKYSMYSANARLILVGGIVAATIISILVLFIQKFNKKTKQLIDIRKKLMISIDTAEEYKQKLESLLVKRTQALEIAQEVVKSAPTPLAIINIENKKVFSINKAMLDFMSLDVCENVTNYNFFRTTDIYKDLKKQIEKNGKVDRATIQIYNNGTKEMVWCLLSMHPIQISREDLMVISFTDINDQVELRGNLQIAKEEAEKATRLKSSFLANMSHEIRTPINGIVGLNDLMRNTSLSEKQIDYTNKIGNSSRTLLHIINDILDFSKIEAGKLNIEETKFSIETVLSLIKDTMAIKAFRKGIELVIDIDENVPEYIIGDPLRLEQVLLNLTNNAIKFTEEGSIIIEVIVIEEEGDFITLKFSVEDTGVGIRDDQVNMLFTPFTQADTSTTRKHGGTGLGLVISKKLVEMMGGEIRYDSIYGKGSKFYFTIKVHKLNEKEESSSYKIDIPECFIDSKILVVIENNYTRNILHKYLSQLGNPPKLLSCGEEAVGEPRNRNYDLVIMDYKMEGLGGVESWHIIRDMLNKDNIPKIIMVTAYGVQDATFDAELEHIDEVLIKPISQSKLYDAILSLSCDKIHTDKSYEEDKSNSKLSSNEGEGFRILLVEDNEINQQVAKELLELRGFSVDVAENGKEALNKLRIIEDYEVVLMDLQMPVMDGYEATKLIRNMDKYKHIPIIALSADAMQGTRQVVLDAGMSDYITKPIDQKILIDTISIYISKGNLLAEKGVSNTTMKKKVLIKLLTHINAEEGLIRVNDNIDLYIKILNKFKSTYSNFGETVLKLISDGKNEELHRLVHTLKGVSATIGAQYLNEIVKGFEQTIKSEETNKDLIDSKIELIKLELKEIITEINSIATVTS